MSVSVNEHIKDVVMKTRKNSKKKRSMCAGCYDDFYNGNNQLGVAECWNFDSAVLVKSKEVPIWRSPPYNDIHCEYRLSCYRKQGYVYLENKLCVRQRTQTEVKNGSRSTPGSAELGTP